MRALLGLAPERTGPGALAGESGRVPRPLLNWLVPAAALCRNLDIFNFAARSPCNWCFFLPTVGRAPAPG